MLRCNECGYSNAPGQTSCAKCGSKLDTASSSASAAGNAASQAAKTVAGGASSAPPIDSTPQGGHKTVMGQASNMPAWDKPAAAASSGGASTDSNIKCPSCGFYPLRAAVSATDPCPNCGSKGASASAPSQESAPANPSPKGSGLADGKGAAKTMMLSDLTPEEEEKPGFALVEERSQEQLVFDGEETTLKRDVLDADNMSISGTAHASIKLKDGKWTIQDLSSNGATFIQVKGEVELNDGDKILIGNKIYTFKNS